MMRRRAARSSVARARATSRSRAALSARRCSSTSVNAVTDPGPSGRSNGAVEYAIHRIEPSLRTSQSSLSASGSPVSRARVSGQSSSGYGVPSGYL